MSRSGLIEDDGDDQLAHGRWRGRVVSATRGQRGQRFFAELRDALDAMPVKELIDQSLATTDGAVCALGAAGRQRGLDVAALQPDDPEDDYDASYVADKLADVFNVATCLVQEVIWENDECSRSNVGWRTCSRCHGWGELAGFSGVPRRCSRCENGRSRVYSPETPAQRWTRMRAWAVSQIRGAA